MNHQLFNSLHLRGFLSFGPESKPVRLTGLNVLIGPNGVGKSNFIEAVELLRATPSDFSEAIRVSGLPGDWMWHGEGKSSTARIEALLSPVNGSEELKYGIEFTESGGRLEIVDEFLENAQKPSHDQEVFSYFGYRHGMPIIRMLRDFSFDEYDEIYLSRGSINPQQSILSQKKDRDFYPVLTTTGMRFDEIQIFREWGFGRFTTPRLPQSSNLPTDMLLPQLTNFGLVLNDLEHRPEWNRLNALMTRFIPRYTRLSTRVSAGSVQVYIHEDGLSTPVPATRLSDGTLRFLALLVILLKPESTGLICIEEPELGLHPDTMSILAELLLEVSTKTQLIVTTHSDVLVSELTENAESVLVCDYGQDGTELRRLETDLLKFWLEKYRLGEIWRLGKIGGNL